MNQNNSSKNQFCAINQTMTRYNSLSTPIKHHSMPSSAHAAIESYSSPFTPHSSDHLFQSVPRLNNLLSSPPVPNSFTPDNNQFGKCQVNAPPLKLSLNIGADGKATIVKPDMFRNIPLRRAAASEPIVEARTESVQQRKTEVTGSNEKNKILNLLKKMRSSTATLNTGNKVKKPSHVIQTNLVEKKIDKISTPPSNTPIRANATLNDITHNALNTTTLPQVTISSSPSAPSTPRSKPQFRSGFTPSLGLDLVLSNNISPRIFFNNTSGMSNHHESSSIDGSLLNFASPSGQFSPRTRLLPKPLTNTLPQPQSQQQFPFKYSGSDPLLITDVENGNWFEVMNSNNSINHNSASMNGALSSSLLLASPKAHLNSFTSPIANIRKLKPTKTKSNIEPATPKEKNLNLLNPSLQFTPLIQKTMNGSLSNKIVHSAISISPLPNNLRRNSVTNRITDSESGTSNENDDASLTLKRLINRG